VGEKAISTSWGEGPQVLEIASEGFFRCFIITSPNEKTGCATPKHNLFFKQLFKPQNAPLPA
jgi:hypothetical protein